MWYFEQPIRNDMYKTRKYWNNQDQQQTFKCLEIQYQLINISQKSNSLMSWLVHIYWIYLYDIHNYVRLILLYLCSIALYMVQKHLNRFLCIQFLFTIIIILKYKICVIPGSVIPISCYWNIFCEQVIHHIIANILLLYFYITVLLYSSNTVFIIAIRAHPSSSKYLHVFLINQIALKLWQNIINVFDLHCH